MLQFVVEIDNPLLVGESGVGKTAIVEGLATRIVDGEVPPSLMHKRILALDLSLVVAGTKYRGQFEERLKAVMNEIRESDNIIIFIDELDAIGKSRSTNMMGNDEREQTLNQIDKLYHALERVNEGGYGACENCGKPINSERLAILPTATLCTDCAQQQEANSGLEP